MCFMDGRGSRARTFFDSPGSWLTGSNGMSCKEKSFTVPNSSYYCVQGVVYFHVSFLLCSYDLHYYFSASLSVVEIDKYDLLPRSETESPLHTGDRERGFHEGFALT